jgi:hypothetical protein
MILTLRHVVKHGTIVPELDRIICCLLIPKPTFLQVLLAYQNRRSKSKYNEDAMI